jgi:hypothetical protein
VATLNPGNGRFGLTDLDFVQALRCTVIMQNQLSISLFCADVLVWNTKKTTIYVVNSICANVVVAI